MVSSGASQQKGLNPLSGISVWSLPLWVLCLSITLIMHVRLTGDSELASGVSDCLFFVLAMKHWQPIQGVSRLLQLNK